MIETIFLLRKALLTTRKYIITIYGTTFHAFMNLFLHKSDVNEQRIFKYILQCVSDYQTIVWYHIVC